MSTCAHCNRTFTCGCQKTTVDGIVVCKTCVTNYKQSKKNIAANKVDLSSFMPKKKKETNSAASSYTSAPTKVRPDQSIGVGAGPQYMQQYTNMVPDTIQPSKFKSEEEYS